MNSHDSERLYVLCVRLMYITFTVKIAVRTESTVVASRVCCWCWVDLFTYLLICDIALNFIVVAWLFGCVDVL